MRYHLPNVIADCIKCMLAFSVFIFACATNDVFADEISPALKPYKIKYKIHLRGKRLGGTVLGKVEAVLKETDDGFSVQAKAKSLGLGAILLGNMQETCQFTFEDTTRAVSSTCNASVGKDDYAVDYQWPDRKLKFNDDEVLDMPQGYVMNITVMPFAVAALKGENLGDEVMYVVDAKNKRLRGYKHRITETETIKTKIGEVDTVKVTMERELRPNRTITMWLSPEHDYLPIKMEERRKSRVTTLKISSIELDA